MERKKGSHKSDKMNVDLLTQHPLTVQSVTWAATHSSASLMNVFLVISEQGGAPPPKLSQLTLSV